VERRRLGTGGPTVGALALGTMTFGAETSEREAWAQLDRFVAVGGDLVDTADVYAGGAAERIVGAWLRERDPSVVVATKSRFGPGPTHGASRRAIHAALEGSLRRLGRERVDVHLVHGWDPHTPLEETLEALGELREREVVTHTGWSNVTGWQLQRIVTTARSTGLPVPVALQPQHNLLERGVELDLLPVCLEEGIGTLPWSPLGGGWLTGKYDRDHRPTGSTRLGEDPGRGVEAYDLRNTDRTWRIVDEVARIAAAHEVTAGEVAIAWLLTRPTVTSVLLGSRTDDQLRTNLAAAELTLSAEETASLTAVSDPGLPAYPHGLVRDACGLEVWSAFGLDDDPS
jgi:aryl-alcohol dehydrogenase-like predicted oxidoreductase